MAAPNNNPSPTLFKNRSWSPDIHRNKQWERMKIKQLRRNLLCRSMSAGFDVTEEDVRELRACFELGFGFGLDALDPKLKRVFPALELYAAVNRRRVVGDAELSRSSSMGSESSFESDSALVVVGDSGDDPEMVKMRLKRWAQVVACSIHETIMQPTIEFAG